jgi:cobalamin biosynthesis protein CobT
MNRFDLRAANDAAERRTEGEEQVEEEEEEEETEDEEEPSDEAEEEEGGEEEEEPEEEAEEEAPRKKKAKAKAKVKPAAPKPKRTREKKVVRMKVVWAVFNNSNQRVAAFEYPKKGEADALASKLTTDKKSTHFVQPVKEPIEEKKEEK